MTSEDLEPALVEAYRRGRLSLLHYIGQATPYAGPKDRPTAARIAELSRAEAADLDALADYLVQRRESIPRVGSFPPVFTNYNFVTVPFLLPRLVEDQKNSLALLEQEIQAVPPSKDREWLEKLAAENRSRLRELEKLMQ